MQAHVCKPCVGARCQSYLFFRRYPSCFERQGLSGGPVADQPATPGICQFAFPWENYRLMPPFQFLVGLCLELRFSCLRGKCCTYWTASPAPESCYTLFTLRIHPLSFTKYHSVVFHFYFLGWLPIASICAASRKLELRVVRWESYT